LHLPTSIAFANIHTTLYQQQVIDPFCRTGPESFRCPLGLGFASMWSRMVLVAAVLLLHAVVSNANHEPHPLDEVLVHMVRVKSHASITMKINSTVLEKSGQWFEVSWEGVPDPDFGDWIALYVPAEADFTQTAPAKYQLATSSLSHMKDGSGTLK
jgi:hypothetical protein